MSSQRSNALLPATILNEADAVCDFVHSPSCPTTELSGGAALRDGCFAHRPRLAWAARFAALQPKERPCSRN